MNNLFSNIKDHFSNVPGWRTKRRIVVFESDDWGMQRMPSKTIYNQLLSKGYPIDKSIYNKYDSLESNDDLSALMEVLISVKDKFGNPAIFTINNVVANPDFEKIRANNFNEYFYENFTQTLNRSQRSDKVIQLYKEGIASNVFKPQFHSREHVHVYNWLSKLKSSDKVYLDAFDSGLFTINDLNGSSCKHECLDAMATYSEKDYLFIENMIVDGVRLFKEIWGFESDSVIAPCYTWSSSLEAVFKKCNIKYVQGARGQREPTSINEPFIIKRNYCGKRNRDGLIYLVRNVNFEQIENNKIDIVNKAIKQIETAFFWNKPAIISTHRVNYIGSNDETNRKKNLKLLKELLNKLTQKYTDIEFLSSDQLGKIISNKG